MNPILTSYLVNRYSGMYKEFSKGITPKVPFYPMAFGFECGDGWYKLIDKLSAKIYKYINRVQQENFYVIQVKEKFGTLRFYTSWEDKLISKYIQDAEKESAKTCETCGAKGKLYAKGWYVTSCPRHYKEWKIGLDS